MNCCPFILITSFLLISCGGDARGGGEGGSGGKPPALADSPADPEPSAPVFNPCASKQCGEVCSPCEPGDPACAAELVEAYCDASGACSPGVPICGDTCSNDADCGYGVEWCDEGRCVPCDSGASSGACDLACPPGQALYKRNGCSPCACAPVSDCIMDGDCPAPPGSIPACYAGAFCWGWCPPGEPSCCYGNTCSLAGCEGPSPAGCFTRGCPEGEVCVARGCSPSACSCDGEAWVCTNDCGGGQCVKAGAATLEKAAGGRGAR